MNEMTKTSIFLAVAVVAGVAAAFFRPAPISVPLEGVGDKLFPAFTDATAAAGLEIVRYEPKDDEILSLKIVNQAGVWSIASHKDYPADAKDAEQRIRNMAINMMDLEVLGVATDVIGDHEEFGVVEPDREKIQQGQKGVGQLVSVLDSSGKHIAQLIIGGDVQGLEGQRFVRRSGQSRVYVVKLDAQKLSSRFEDWIDNDLLQINKNDFAQVRLKDYSFGEQFALGPNGLVPRWEQRLEVVLDWDAKDFKWKLNELLEDRGGRLAPSALVDDEELNTQKLDQLRDGLDELKIVDVISKPKGLSAGLEANRELLGDQETMRSLITRGFFPVQIGGSRAELLSSDGEVRVRTNDAVEYILRFGRVAGVEERDDKTNLKRYLLVSARVSDEALTPPELTPLPEAQKPEEKPPAPEGKSADSEKKDEAKPDETKADEPKKDDPNSDETKADDAKANETKADEPKAEEPKAEEPKADDAKAAEAKAKAEADALAAARLRVERENQRKLDEYNERRVKAQDRVKQLNDRFGKWYYVISEDVYRKIHLGRFDVIKVKTEKEKAFGIDVFRELEREGIKKPDDHDHANDPRIPQF
jgi:hypothetical protein